MVCNTMSVQLTLPKWYDLHVHLRQGALLNATVAGHIAAQCAGIVAMPNTVPPVATVTQTKASPYWSIASYHEMILQAGAAAFDKIIIPLYLTQDTTPKMIEAGVASGLLQACKYYPPYGTTHADHGRPMEYFMENGVLQAMQAHGVVLCVHGEMHDMAAEDYFARDTNAEEMFYQQQMPLLRERYPKLKIVCEHVTTKVAVDFVQASDDHIAASITPQHLMYTVGDLLQGLSYHLYCLPIAKFATDRQALRQAVIGRHSSQFFAGTDSAPHTQKVTACGCAAGCYTAPIAPQLYASAFEMAGVDLAVVENQMLFQQFLCQNGARFYDLPIPTATFILQRSQQAVDIINTPAGDLVPLPVGLNPHHAERGTVLDWQIVT